MIIRTCDGEKKLYIRQYDNTGIRISSYVVITIYNILLKGLRPGAGNAGSTFSWVPSQNTQNDNISPKPRFSGPEPGFGPDEVIFGCFGGVFTKRDHIWLKPMVLGPKGVGGAGRRAGGRRRGWAREAGGGGGPCWEQRKVQRFLAKGAPRATKGWFHQKPNNWFDLANKSARGDGGGGAPKSSVGATKMCTGSFGLP